MRSILPPLALFLASLWAPPQGRTAPGGASVELAEVLEVAVRHSPTLKRARIDVAIARAQILQATGIEDLLLAASGNASLFRNRPVEGNFVGTNERDLVGAEVSLSKLLGTGGTLSLNLGSNRTQTIFAATGTEALEYSSSVTAELAQPLLRDRGPEVTRAGQRQARTAAEIDTLQLETDTRDEVRKLVEAYWELIYAHRDLEIRESALELALESRRLTSSAIRLGSAARTALLEVDQVIATREEDILLARQRITERSLELRNLAGLPISAQNLDLTPSEALNANPRDLNLAEIIQQTLASSPELAILDRQKEGALIEVEVGENGLLPRLDVRLSAGPLGTAQTLGDSLRGAAEFQGYSVGGSLRLEQSLGRRSARGATRRARDVVRQISVDREEMKRRLAAAAVRAVRAAETARKRMVLSQRAIDLSAKNIEAERRRFELGRSTNFDVLERQEEQKQARLRYARATVDYLQASAAIDALTGVLLDDYGISVAPPQG